MKKKEDENPIYFKFLSPSELGEIDSIKRALISSYHYPIGGNNTVGVDEGLKTLAICEQPDRAAVAYICWQEGPFSWEIIDLGVHPAWHRKGLMSLMMQRVISRLPLGFELWLEVHEHNLPALTLYLKMGFSRVGRRERYYRDGAAAMLLTYG